MVTAAVVPTCTFFIATYRTSDKWSIGYKVIRIYGHHVHGPDLHFWSDIWSLRVYGHRIYGHRIYGQSGIRSQPSWSRRARSVLLLNELRIYGQPVIWSIGHMVTSALRVSQIFPLTRRQLDRELNSCPYHFSVDGGVINITQPSHENVRSLTTSTVPFGTFIGYMVTSGIWSPDIWSHRQSGSQFGWQADDSARTSN